MSSGKNRLTSWLKRRFDPQLETRLTREQALEIARRYFTPDSELYNPGATAVVEYGRVVWRVVTHVGMRGGHSQIYVDDQSGEVVRTHHVEL